MTSKTVVCNANKNNWFREKRNVKITTHTHTQSHCTRLSDKMGTNYAKRDAKTNSAVCNKMSRDSAGK